MKWVFLWFSLEMLAAQIQIGNQTLSIEIASSPEERRIGLMGRQTLEEGTGMLFVFETSGILSFWMKNTKIPLSIGFFDSDKILVNWLDMEPEGNALLPSYQSSKPAKFALEVPQGWFRRHKIQPGMKFSFPDSEKEIY